MRTGVPEHHIGCTITEVCIYCVKMLIKKYDEGGVLVFFWIQSGCRFSFSASIGRDQVHKHPPAAASCLEQNQKRLLRGEAAPAEGLLWFFGGIFLVRHGHQRTLLLFLCENLSMFQPRRYGSSITPGVSLL